MNQVIEHLKDPHRILSKVREILRPGGLVFVETPSDAGWDAKLVPAIYWGGWHTPRHFIVYSEDTLRRALEQNGFKVVAVKYIFSPFLWADTIKFFLQERFGIVRFHRFLSISSFPFLCLIGIIESIQLLFRRRSSNLRIVARKL